MSPETFDYIIAGGGLAGLSLAHRINRSTLRDRRLLIIDREEKSSNDHTWCFWSDTDSGFEDIVFHRWKKLGFHGASGNYIPLDLGAEGFEYKMVRAEDFYSTVIPELRENPKFTFANELITRFEDGIVYTEQGEYIAKEIVFDSTAGVTGKSPKYTFLLQHFLGWFVEAEEDSFDPDEATLFDFRVPQKGGCRFVYVLPYSSRRALVEFTLFSPGPLAKDEYEDGLRRYISEVLGIGKYNILEEELGAIPMTDEPQKQVISEHEVQIGTSGGWVKPSTGYSFLRTQERTEAIVRALESGLPVPEFGNPWKLFLDSVMLNVIENGRPPAAEAFEAIFKNNPPSRVFRFLDEKTGVADDLRLMATVPLLPFTKAAVSEAYRKFWR